MLYKFNHIDTTSTCEMKFALNLKLGAKMTLSKMKVMNSAGLELNDLCIFSRLLDKKRSFFFLNFKLIGRKKDVGKT